MARRLFLPTACWLIAILLLTGVLQPPLTSALANGLGQRAEDYLDRSLTRAMLGFASASTIKGALALVEGSEVGFSFVGEMSVEVGDLIQPTYDYVDIAWHTLFTGSLVLLCLRLLLETSYMIAPYILGVALLLYGGMLWLGPPTGRRRRWRATVRDGATAALALVLAVAFVLPLSVLGAEQLSSWITAPHVVAAHAELAALEGEMAPDGETADYSSNPRHWKTRVEDLVRTVSQRGTNLIESTLRLIAGYIFDCVVFPLALLYLGLRLSRILAAYAISRASSEEMLDALKTVRREGRA